MLGFSAVAFVHFRETPTEQEVMHVSLPLPDEANNGGVGFLSPPPDGRRVVASVGSALAVRDLDAAAWTPIAIGTNVQVFTPFWSHDGRAIGFFGDGLLIALIEEADVITRILRHLGLPREIPAPRPARAPPLPASTPDQTGWDDDPSMFAPVPARGPARRRAEGVPVTPRDALPETRHA